MKQYYLPKNDSLLIFLRAEGLGHGCHCTETLMAGGSSVPDVF